MGSATALLAFAACDESPSPQPEPESTQATPTGDPGKPHLAPTTSLTERELMRYVGVLQRFVTAARDNDCDAAWSMGNKDLHQADGRMNVFCKSMLPAVAEVDLSTGTLEVASETYIRLALPEGQTISLSPAADGTPRIRGTALQFVD